MCRDSREDKREERRAAKHEKALASATVSDIEKSSHIKFTPDKEMVILDLYSRGFSDKQISELCGIMRSLITVWRHQKQLAKHDELVGDALLVAEAEAYRKYEYDQKLLKARARIKKDIRDLDKTLKMLYNMKLRDVTIAVVACIAPEEVVTWRECNNLPQHE